MWSEKTIRFEELLAKVESLEEREVTRAKYAIQFDGHTFSHSSILNLEEYAFPCSVSFAFTSFRHGVLFDFAKFGNGDVSFHNTRFGNDTTSFYCTDFGNGNVSFEEAQFEQGMVRFTRTTFGKGHVNFYRATSKSGNVGFSNLNLTSTHMSLRRMAIGGNLIVDCSFPLSVNFEGLTVDGAASFSGCSFGEIPDFRGVKFAQLPEIARMKVPVPALVKSQWAIFEVCHDPEAVEKYRKLKSMALSANDHEKDGEFFAYEMMAKRGVETTAFWPLMFNSLYNWVSFYGQSFTRPLWRLFLSWAVFAYAYLCVLSFKLDDRSGTLVGMEMSLRNTLPLSKSLFQQATSSEKIYNGWFQEKVDGLALSTTDFNLTLELLVYLGAVQQLLSAIFLFFFFLGLRNKFRLK